ncbi:putative potassium transporter 12 [Hevea brasiliensis]|uniref:putative potassium transporter 12 n=1 Tax=Hevea brasiliensis TaxID=3981 RepID=UPI0025D6F47E|nr:putative potassium transporter 12 [Hevea brasiliensis]
MLKPCRLLLLKFTPLRGSMLSDHQPADEHISSLRLKLPTAEMERTLNIKDTLKRKSSLKKILFLLILMGTSMVIGDGILTPAISVMSAISGAQGETPRFGTSRGRPVDILRCTVIAL